MRSVDSMPISKKRQVKINQKNIILCILDDISVSIPHCLPVRFHSLPVSLRKGKSIG